MKISRDNYVHIEGWMRTDFNLKGNELLTYAVVYGFTQDGLHWFSGSRQYIADWAGCSKATISRALASLTEAGLLVKRTRNENGMTFNDFRAVPPTQFDDGGCTQNEQGGVLKMSTHTIERDTNKETIDIQGKRKRFIPPTVEEVRAYCQARNNSINPQHFVDYYTANGWMVGRSKMKDWQATVRTWESREKKQPFQQKQDTRKFCEIDHTLWASNGL